MLSARIKVHAQTRSTCNKGTDNVNDGYAGYTLLFACIGVRGVVGDGIKRVRVGRWYTESEGGEGRWYTGSEGGFGEGYKEWSVNIVENERRVMDIVV